METNTRENTPPEPKLWGLLVFAELCFLLLYGLLGKLPVGNIELGGTYGALLVGVVIGWLDAYAVNRTTELFRSWIRQAV